MTHESDDPPNSRSTRHLSSLPPSAHWTLVTFMQLVMATELIFLLVQSQWLTAVAVAGVMSVVAAWTLLAPRLSRFRLAPEYELMVSAVLVLSALLLSEVLHYYDRYVWWDAVLHTWAGSLLGTFGLLLVHALNRSRSIEPPLRPAFTALFAFLFAISIGTFWEIFEFAANELFGQRMQGSLSDTMWDLIFDAIGAATVSVVGWWYLNRRERPLTDRKRLSFAKPNRARFRD